MGKLKTFIAGLLTVCLLSAVPANVDAGQSNRCGSGYNNCCWLSKICPTYVILGFAAIAVAVIVCDNGGDSTHSGGIILE